MKKILSIVFLLFVYVCTHAQSPNDEPCGAITLTPTIATSLPSTCTPTTNLSWVVATVSATTPTPSCGNWGAGKKDVWYKITVPANVDSILINTAVGTVGAATADAVMTLYSATACGGVFTEIGCNDDSGAPSPNNNMPLIKTAIPAAGIYYLRIFDYNVAIANGDMKICINLKISHPPIDPSKRVGIGTTIPEYNLDVNGTGKFRSNVILDSTTTARDMAITNTLKITSGTPAANKVLTSDAVGNATWQTAASASATAWGLVGNAGTNAATNFIGTIDNVPLSFRVENKYMGKIDLANHNVAFGDSALGVNTSFNNVAIGANALFKNTSSSGLVAIGARSQELGIGGNSNVSVGVSTLRSNTGSKNTAVGSFGLTSNTSGENNTAIGNNALQSNTTGIYNTVVGESAANRNETANYITAIGAGALFYNVADANTAIGNQAAKSNATGKNIIAIGNNALANNTVKNDLIAIGDSALYNNGIGAGQTQHSTNNIAIGSKALILNTTGNTNIALGNSALVKNTTGFNNTALGAGSLASNQTGTNNVAIGPYALLSNNASFNIAIGTITGAQTTTGKRNIFLGNVSGFSNISGDANIAIGNNAMYSNIEKSGNIAIGDSALYYTNSPLKDRGEFNVAVGPNSIRQNIEGSHNTAVGFSTLKENLSSNNTAIGSLSLYGNTTGAANTGIGSFTLFSNTTGSYNVALGTTALNDNTIGNRNNAIGNYALLSNISGNENTSMGDSSMIANTTGSFNVAIGKNSLSKNIGGGLNVSIGYGNNGVITSGNGNTCIGSNAGPKTNVSNYIGIGNTVGTLASASNMVELGNNFISVIRGQVGFTTYSDKRIKQNIQQDVPGLSFINKLQPVTYFLDVHKQNELMQARTSPDYEGKYNIEKMRMTGFLAQDVEQAAKDCKFDFSGVVKPQNEHDLYSLRYSEFVVPLVKAVQEQQTQIELLKQQNEILIKRLETLEKK
jgi:trimeric autotransporter adhesin